MEDGKPRNVYIVISRSIEFHVIAKRRGFIKGSLDSRAYENAGNESIAHFVSYLTQHNMYICIYIFADMSVHLALYSVDHGEELFFPYFMSSSMNTL